MIVRSIAFNVLFYLNLVLQMVLALPALLMPRSAVTAVMAFWARSNLWLLRHVCGINAEFRGIDKIPPGAVLLASKHQSIWETFALLGLVADPVFVLKRELQWIPFFGWYAWKAAMIPVDRGRRGLALTALTERARIELQRGRQIIIFPEGTRRAPDAEPRYKFGVAHLYAETATPCVPIALNSGLFWPRRSFLRFPGTIVVEVLDPIPPGLGKVEFIARLQSDIETATARLIAEARDPTGKGVADPSQPQAAA